MSIEPHHNHVKLLVATETAITEINALIGTLYVNVLRKLTLFIGSSISKCSLHLRKSRHTSRASVRAFTGITLEVAQEEVRDAALDLAESLSRVLDAVLGVPHPWSGDDGSFLE